jgi:PAS domain S-box-containing protein
MPAAGAGLLEAGAPSFVVLGPEALGMSFAPKDMHVLPDGRILLVSQNELVIGDGVRWEAFRADDRDPPSFLSVAVDDDGQIYAGISDGIARIELSAGARRRLIPVVSIPKKASDPVETLTSVITSGDQWYWYGGNGAIITWRPNQVPKVVGRAGAVERIFTLDHVAYVSDQSSGGLYILRPNGVSERVRSMDALVSESVTCTTPFEKGKLLVGTGSEGLKLFDGRTFRRFGPAEWLGTGHRITDICPAGDGYFAASIDTVGIVFFDRMGRTVQVLDRALDHRLARVRSLKYASNGVVWALLNDGVARIEFPSPVSHFEPLLPGGLAFALPLRHAGQLWIQADGRAMHGVYDALGRLERFSDDTPPGRYLFTLADVDGQLFAGNENGVYVLEPAGWRLALPGLKNARLGVAPSTPEGMFYVASGQYGVIRRTGSDYLTLPTSCPELGDTYNSIIDSSGIGWIELGSSRVARFDPRGGDPSLRILGSREGLPDGWVEIYLLDGVARFHVGQRIYRFDESRGRFAEDTELLSHLPQMATAGGRPVTDAFGRLWYTENGAIHIIDHSPAGGDRPVKIAPVGFAPTGYTVEDDGIVWVFERRRLARVDLHVPQGPVALPRALITSVEFSATNRQVFHPGPAMAPVEYSDNSLIFHFVAPANPFASTVTFEVQLEGSGTQWTSTGTTGSATFYRLKEGDYVFRVRPVSSAGQVGREDTLRFSVLAPWYRTRIAWVCYGLATVGAFMFVTWLSSFLQRRENERLERVVAARTAELKETNSRLERQIGETTAKSEALSASEERYRSLNSELEDRVKTRTSELTRSNEELQQRELLFRLIFEHAPVGISWKRADLGDVCHINPTFSRILELPVGILSDYSLLSNLVHPSDARHQAEMDKLIASGEGDSYTIEERFVLAGGRLVWGMRSVAVIREGGRIIQEICILEDITPRKMAEEAVVATHKNLLDASRQAGMAEIATGVLHNVGNVLNSVNVSATLVADAVRRSKVSNIAKLSTLFQQNKADLASFMTKDPRGMMIPDYLGSLSESLASEHEATIAELENLRKNIEHIKEIVAMQQSYAKTSGVFETISVTDIVEDTLRINAGSLARHDIETFRDYQVRPVVTTDKHKVMQILINLVRNAKYACDESGRVDKRITVRTTGDDRSVRISIVDNGIGIPEANLARIFNHGFTTRANGHGFGLHSGALAAKELGGSLSVQSEGTDRGASFILEIPFKPPAQAHENNHS